MARKLFYIFKTLCFLIIKANNIVLHRQLLFFFLSRPFADKSIKCFPVPLPCFLLPVCFCYKLQWRKQKGGIYTNIWRFAKLIFNRLTMSRVFFLLFSHPPEYTIDAHTQVRLIYCQTSLRQELIVICINLLAFSCIIDGLINDPWVCTL